MNGPERSGSPAPALPFDIVFADTCVGGSTVASRLARTRKGVRAFFLADYAVNPLGTKSQEAVQAALNRWVDAAAGRASELVIACNTASVRLRELPEVVERAHALGLSVHSMADFLEATLEREGRALVGRRVCLMGTEFTVGQKLYRASLAAAGAGEVVPLPATLTERAIAHLEHDSPEGRRIVLDEVRGVIRASDAVVLACTCFPMVGELLREVNPDLLLLDPAEGAEMLPLSGTVDTPESHSRPEGMDAPGEETNRMTVAMSGNVLSPGQLEDRFQTLFPGWKLEEVRSYRGV